MRRLFRWLGLLALVPVAFVALALALGAVLPPVSTLMLARWLTLRPVERTYVPLDAISPRLVRAVVAAEDARYCAHRGVDWVELSPEIEDALSGEGASRGASTIPMQLAKNLFLWPGRSAVRKGLEIPLAYALTALWGKRRVLEAYLNVAEWGEGVFGIEAGARRAFGRSARDLDPRQAALLAAALPNPILRDPARPRPAHRAAASRAGARAGSVDLGCAGVR